MIGSVRHSSVGRRWGQVVCSVLALSVVAMIVPAMSMVICRADEPEALEKQPLDQEVVTLLQKTAKALESGTVEPAEEPDFRALIAASETLKADRALVPAERVRLAALVRIRLRHAADAIHRQAAREAKGTSARNAQKTAVAQLPDAPPRLPEAPAVSTLAQQIPGAAGAGGQGFGPGQAFAGGIGTPQSGGADQQAEKLIDLIQAVISPNSWDVNGGQGVIRYWSLGHGLVIRNTHAEHDKVGDVLQQLR